MYFSRYGMHVGVRIDTATCHAKKVAKIVETLYILGAFLIHLISRTLRPPSPPHHTENLNSQH